MAGHVRPQRAGFAISPADVGDASGHRMPRRKAMVTMLTIRDPQLAQNVLQAE
jgi:hypothetical protein